MSWRNENVGRNGASQRDEKVADAWEKLEMFDEAGSCIILQEIDGYTHATDITEGLKMANRSGQHALNEMKTVLASCITCASDITVTADKAILRAIETGGKYQCKPCFTEEYFKETGVMCSKTKFRKYAAEATGKSHMTIKKSLGARSSSSAGTSTATTQSITSTS